MDVGEIVVGKVTAVELGMTCAVDNHARSRDWQARLCYQLTMSRPFSVSAVCNELNQSVEAHQLIAVFIQVAALLTWLANSQNSI